MILLIDPSPRTVMRSTDRQPDLFLIGWPLEKRRCSRNVHAMDGPLFDPHHTHIDVTCWSCGHSVTLKRSDPAASMDYGEFQSRARCSKCGVRYPHITRHPRKSSWGNGAG